MVNGFRRQQICGVIHGLTPGPERVPLSAAAVFRAAPDDPLERVGVNIHQAGQDSPIAQPFGPGQIGAVAGKPRNPAGRIRKHREASFERTSGVDEVGQPACFGVAFWSSGQCLRPTRYGGTGRAQAKSSDAAPDSIWRPFRPDECGILRTL